MRFFNVVGSEYKNKIGLTDKKSNHLFTNLFKSFILKKPFIIYGTNYDTNDGTAIRDYINVLDIADIIFFLSKKNYKPNILNCGYGEGYSVFDIVNKFENYFQFKLKIKLRNKRPGDVPYLVCDNTKIKKLGWKPKHKNLFKCFSDNKIYFKKYFFLKN